MRSVFLFFLFTLTLTATAQINKLDIGAEGGFSLASLRGNEVIDSYHDTRIGYSGGLFVQYNFRKIISVRTGGYYERKGSSLEFLFTDINGTIIGTFKGKENFNYLTVPLLVRATFGQKLNYFVNAGPYIGFLMKKTEYTEAFQSIPEITSDQTDLFKKTETGLSFGIGVSYTLKEKFALSFEARNNLGLTDTSDLPVINNGVIKTNAVNFLFGFSYKLGQR
ncbi:MAG: porin family protein [Bacteroidota bacterium]|jgi:hypothetical protein